MYSDITDITYSLANGIVTNGAKRLGTLLAL